MNKQNNDPDAPTTSTRPRAGAHIRAGTAQPLPQASALMIGLAGPSKAQEAGAKDERVVAERLIADQVDIIGEAMLQLAGAVERACQAMAGLLLLLPRGPLALAGLLALTACSGYALEGGDDEAGTTTFMGESNDEVGGDGDGEPVAWWAEIKCFETAGVTTCMGRPWHAADIWLVVERACEIAARVEAGLYSPVEGWTDGCGEGDAPWGWPVEMCFERLEQDSACYGGAYGPDGEIWFGFVAPPCSVPSGVGDGMWGSLMCGGSAGEVGEHAFEGVWCLDGTTCVVELGGSVAVGMPGCKFTNLPAVGYPACSADCPTGTLGCSCGFGGACYEGLDCIAGTCTPCPAGNIGCPCEAGEVCDEGLACATSGSASVCGDEAPPCGLLVEFEGACVVPCEAQVPDFCDPQICTDDGFCAWPG